MQVKEIPNNCRLLTDKQEILNTMKEFNILPMSVGNLWISPDKNIVYCCKYIKFNSYDQIIIFRK